MKANEVHVGNLFHYHMIDEMDERKEWDEVSVIDAQDIILLESDADYRLFKPIPLTEEWLVRFGFKEVEDSTHDIEILVTERYLSIVKDWSKFDFRVYVGSQVEWVQCSRLKYVHQLQNLFFALKGEELEIKSI